MLETSAAFDTMVAGKGCSDGPLEWSRVVVGAIPCMSLYKTSVGLFVSKSDEPRQIRQTARAIHLKYRFC